MLVADVDSDAPVLDACRGTCRRVRCAHRTTHNKSVRTTRVAIRPSRCLVRLEKQLRNCHTNRPPRILSLPSYSIRVFSRGSLSMKAFRGKCSRDIFAPGKSKGGKDETVRVASRTALAVTTTTDNIGHATHLVIEKILFVLECFRTADIF